VRGLVWVFGAILGPLLCFVLDHWVHLIWQRSREERLIGQTVAYFHRPASESNPPHGANPGLTILRTVDLTDSKDILDGLAPCLPNGDLVVYDAMSYDQTERNISNLFPEFAPTFLKPVIAALPVLQAMNPVAVTIMHAAEDIPRECRNRLPGATLQEVAWAVDHGADLARRADKPIGLLFTAVPRLFPEAILHQRLSPEQQPARAAPRCERCGGLGFPGAPCASLGEARELIEAGVQPCTCDVDSYWLEMLR
jgi:hypothetical protein